MKKRLLLLGATMLACVATFAQNWAKPQPTDAAYQFASELKPTQQFREWKSSKGVFETWEGDTTIYALYNVQANAFLSNTKCASHAQWDTHAALKAESANVVFFAKYRDKGEPSYIIDTTYVADIAGKDSAVYDTTGITESIPWDGKTYKLLDLWNKEWKGVFPTAMHAMFVDRANQPDYMWNVKEMGGGVFRISVSDLNPEWNSHMADSIFANPETYLGFFPEDPDYNGGTEGGVMPLTPMLGVEGWAYYPNADGKLELIEATPYIDWKLMTYESYQLYSQHIKAWNYIKDGKLQAYIDEVKSQTSRVDVSSLEAIQNGSTPITWDELDAAVKAVEKAVRLDRIDMLKQNASETNPIDITDLMVNANFNAGNTNGWTLTYVKNTNATNLGYQGANYENNGVKIDKFFEAWAANGTKFNPNCDHSALGDGKGYQLVTDLPMGKYSFACDAIATNQYDGDAVVGAFLYAKSGDYMFQLPIATGNGKPEHFELSFISTEDFGSFEMGFMTEGSTANWMAVDNFELVYYGVVADKDPNLIILESRIEEILAELPAEQDDIFAQQEIIDALFNTIEEAPNGSDYVEGLKKVNDAYTALKASIADYKKLKALMEELELTQEELQDSDYPEVADELSDIAMEWEDEYYEKKVGAEYINAQDTRVYNTIVAVITENIKPGSDITPIILNGDYNKDFSGWDVVGARPAHGGKGGNNANAIGDVPALASGNAEVYQAQFNMSQTLKNLPAGAYQVTVQAFEDNRTTSNQCLTDWESGDPTQGINAVLYANEFETKVNNIMAFAQPERLYQAADEGFWGNDAEKTLSSGDVVYIPNCMDGANFFFDHSPETYLVKCNIILPEPGDITIGIKTEGTKSWVIFDNFRLKYLGLEDPSIYYEQIEETIDMVSKALAAEYIGKAEEAQGQAAIAALTAALNGGSVDDCMSSITLGEEATKAINASAAAYSALYESYAPLSEAIETYEGTAPAETVVAATEILNKIEDVLDALDLAIADIEALTTKALYYASNLKYSGYDEVPFDMTDQTIKNASFDVQDDYTGWLGDSFGSGGTKYTSAERYNMTFDTYQDIYGLPAGNYVLSVQGFYRRGGSADDWKIEQEDPDSLRNCVLYAKTTSAEYSTPVASCASGAIDKTEVIGAGREGTVEVGNNYKMPNTMLSADDWFISIDPKTDKPYYLNEVVFSLTEGESLRIGVKLEKKVGDAGWALFDNFKLVYYADQVPDAIDEVLTDVKTPVIIGIFNLNGQKLSAPQKGINIINGKKVLVK